MPAIAQIFNPYSALLLHGIALEWTLSVIAIRELLARIVRESVRFGPIETSNVQHTLFIDGADGAAVPDIGEMAFLTAIGQEPGSK